MADDDGIRVGGRSPLSAISQLLAVGQLERAQQMARDLIAADPENPGSHLVLARVLLTMEKPEPALQAMGEAIRLAPGDDSVWGLQSETLFQLGRFAESEVAILRALEIAADDPWYHYQYALLLTVNERRAQALKAVEKALEFDPDSHANHALRAALLMQVHPRKWSVSVEAAERALRLDPEDPFAHAVLGMIRLQQGDRAGAEERFRAALLLDPTSALARQGLAHTVMASNPLYRPMLAFNLRLMQAGQAGALGILFGAWAIQRTLVQALGSYEATLGLAQGIRTAWLVFAVYTWFAAPITSWILRRHHPWLADVKHF